MDRFATLQSIAANSMRVKVAKPPNIVNCCNLDTLDPIVLERAKSAKSTPYGRAAIRIRGVSDGVRKSSGFVPPVFCRCVSFP
jgi:hypothetical protein